KCWAVAKGVSFSFTVSARSPGRTACAWTAMLGCGGRTCSASVATGSCSIAFSSAGARNVTASYPGDGNFATSTSTAVSQTVGAASTTTAITTHTPNPSVTGQGIAVAFTVTSGGGTDRKCVAEGDGG